MTSKKQDDKKQADDKTDNLEAIDVSKIYPLKQFQRLAGAGDWMMRQMRRNGLKVRRVGGKAFVRGQDWFEFLGEDQGE